MRQISDRRDSDRRDSDRRDGDRRDSDRRDSDRRDNSKSLRQNDRYSSSKCLSNAPKMRFGNDDFTVFCFSDRGNRNDDRSDDRRRNMDKGYSIKGRSRNTMEFKNQNRNKSHEYEGRGGGGGLHNRNNSGGHSDSRNQPHHHHHDDEHVESVSFTNSKLNNNSNRFSNVDYSNVGSIQGREYGIQEPAMVIFQFNYMKQRKSNEQKKTNILQQQQTQNQQSQSQQRFQLVSNEIPHNLESGQQMANQQNSQSTLLTTNHSLPISSSVIGECRMIGKCAVISGEQRIDGFCFQFQQQLERLH